MQKYQLLYEGLKRETNKEKKLQKKYSRKGKTIISGNNISSSNNNNTNTTMSRNPSQQLHHN